MADPSRVRLGTADEDIDPRLREDRFTEVSMSHKEASAGVAIFREEGPTGASAPHEQLSSQISTSHDAHITITSPETLSRLVPLPLFGPEFADTPHGFWARFAKDGYFASAKRDSQIPGRVMHGLGQLPLRREPALISQKRNWVSTSLDFMCYLSARKSHVEGFYAQAVGEILPRNEKCVHCARNNGPCLLVVSLLGG